MIYYVFYFFYIFLFSSQVFANDLNSIDNFFQNTHFSLEEKLSIQTSLIICLLTFSPAIILIMTCFTRIIIVFGLLRNALGTPYLPSNYILITLSLFLTFFVMEPTMRKMYHQSYVPFSLGKISVSLACRKGFEPLQEFMLKQIQKKDLFVFSKLAHVKLPKEEKEIPIRVLIPSFITSEIQTAFKIGFLIFIPFLIIDLLISSILMSLGMMMVPPAIISLPLKLIIFVLADGWQLLITSLVRSFHV